MTQTSPPGRHDTPGTAILLIEDDANLVKALRYLLEKEGYAVHTVSGGLQGLEAAERLQPDLVLLDIMLPEMDGLQVCRTLRARYPVPIIFMTAKAEEVDRVLGLELGADDYITKPFSTRELVARIRAVLRRTRPNLERIPAPFESGDLIIDFQARQVRRSGVPLVLSPREFALLGVLVSQKYKALTREQILERLDGPGHIGDVRTVDVHVRWLREKIEPQPDRPTRIVTVRGVGYRFDG